MVRFSDKPQFSHAQQIAHLATQKFLAGEVDEVYVIYTHFKSALSQDTRIVKMLPITQKEGQQEGGRGKNTSSRRIRSSSSTPCCRSIWICSFTTASFSPLPANSVPV